MSDVLPWESEEKRNYMCMVSVVDDIIASELRKIFKQEWNSRYQACYGAWDDTSTSGQELFRLEKARSRPNGKMFQAKFLNGDTNQWDCSVLFDAILWSNSIGKSKLNPTTQSEVDKLRTLRNDIKHKETPTLSDADFQAKVTYVENAFHALGIPINDISKIKNERNKCKSFQVLPSKPTHEVVYRSEKIEKVLHELETLRTDGEDKLTYYYISGNPGSGKSQLSRQVCENLHDGVNWETETSFIMTLNGKDPDVLLNSYLGFCRRLSCCDSTVANIINLSQPKEKKVEQLRSLIATKIKNWKKWWIIVDNVEDLDMIYKLLPQMGDNDWNNGQIILTIQNTTSVPCDSSLTKHISLSNGMESHVSRQLLSLLSGTDVNDPVLEEVSEKLDHQPLALAAASVYLQRVKGAEFSWQDFLRKLEEGKRDIMDEKFLKMNSVYPHTMSAAVGLAVRKSAENNFILEHTFHLFSLISFHPLPLDIIVQYIQQLNKSYDKDEIYLEIKTSSLFLMENEDRDVRLHRVIYEAVKFFSGCNGAQTAICSNETKVSNVIKAIYCFKGRDDKIKIIPHLKAFIAAIKKLFPEENALHLVGPDLEKHEIYEIYMFFGEILQYYSELKLAVEFHKLNAQMWRGGKDDYFRMIRIYEHLGSLYHDLGELEKAKESYKGVLELCKTFMGEMSFDVASAYMNLGLVYQCEGRNEEANVNFERVLEIVIGILNHGDLASFYNALGAGYLKTNQVEDAKTCHEQALQIQQKNFGSDHSEISFNCNRIALMYGANGELELANDWNQRAVKIREGQVGPTNVHVAYPCSNREIMHDENGQMDSVTNCHQQGQEIGADNQFGRKHVDLANSPTLRVCELIGEQKLPKNCLQQALENIEKQLGPSHVGVATAFYHLGTVYKNMGELDQAKDFHQRALGIREKKLGPNHVDVANSYYELGAACYENGEQDRAEVCHQRALEIREKKLGPNHVDVANSYYELGVACYENGEQDRAEVCHQRALEIRKNQLGLNHVDVGHSYNELGAVFCEKGELDRAKDCHQRALEIREKHLGPDHVYVASSYNNLGAVYFKKDELIQAKDCHQRALEIREKRLGPDHVDVAWSYCNLGHVYYKNNELDQAKDCSQRALEIREKQLVPNHVDVASSYNELGLVCYEKDELDLAKDYHERALEIREKHLGPDHVDVANSYHNLGAVYFKKDELDLSNDCHQRALQIREKQLGPNHVDVASSYNMLGVVCYEKGELDLSKDCHQQALRIREKQLGPNHVDVASSYNMLGLVCFEKNELEVAKNCHQRALEIREKEFGPNHASVATSYHNLGAMYLKKGELDLSKDCHQRALQIREKQLGPNHVGVASSYNELGVVCYEKDELELAKNCYQRALEIREKEFGPNHASVATSYHNLGVVYIGKGELDMAKDCLQRALEIRENHLGAYHLDVANSYDNLGLLYLVEGEWHRAGNCFKQAQDLRTINNFIRLLNIMGIN